MGHRSLCRKSVFSAVVFVVFFVITVSPAEVSVRGLNCTSVSMLFEARKINITDVAKTPISGQESRFCNNAASCCPERTEELLRTSLRLQHEQMVAQQITTVSNILKTRATKFDEFFKDMLAMAKVGFHDMFKRTYGIIYEQNSFVFTDLFEELEKYYATGKVRLVSTMEKFFDKLYQKMFTVINAHYHFNDEYLVCVSKHMESLKPFGDVPRKLSLDIKRSFVATRTFAQSLSLASDVVNNMLNIPVSMNCSQGIMKMTGCPLCHGLQVKSCYNYCSNVMKGCLAHYTELNNEWNTFVDAIDKVTERLIGPFNIQMVVAPIDTKISDAVMNFQENSQRVSQRVFNSCGGKPQLAESQPKAATPAVRNRRASGKGGERHRERIGMELERLVRDIRARVKETKHFWGRLPYQMCNSDHYSNGKLNDTCWNGQSNSSYKLAVMNDGLNNQQHNPEVAVDVLRPNSILNEQVYALKMITNNLKNAYDGNDVDWVDFEDIGSGSGSGDNSDFTGAGEDDEDSGSGMGFPTDKPSTEKPKAPVIDPGNDRDNELHPMDNASSNSHYNMSSSGTSALPPQRMSLNRALLSYLVPVVVMWVGGAVTEWLQ